jgi:hypothetical protein
MAIAMQVFRRNAEAQREHEALKARNAETKAARAEESRARAEAESERGGARRRGRPRLRRRRIGGARFRRAGVSGGTGYRYVDFRKFGPDRNRYGAGHPRRHDISFQDVDLPLKLLTRRGIRHV